MHTTSFKHVAYLADYCAQNGITKIVISPGSRNAPIISAFEAHPDIETFLIHDERVAAFYALGMAEAIGLPVALTCTSGSALLNYAPAIVEAYYRQIPLLILSADRPMELIDQGDGQTIRQKDIYSNFIKSSFALPNHDDESQYEKTIGLSEKVLADLFNSPTGPVHLNIPLEEPLYNTSGFERFKANGIKLDDEKTYTLPVELEEIWKSSEKKMLIVGQLKANKKLEQLVQELAKDPSVAILVENTSNIQSFQHFCHCIDRTLEAIPEEERQDYAPNLLMTIGGAVISKRIKAYFRKYKAQNNWRVGQFLINEDTYQSLTKSINIEPEVFISKLLELNSPALSNFGGKWKQKDFLAKEAHEAFLKTAPYSDLKVFEQILDMIPDNALIHMGNSSVIRYCQLFDPIPGMEYHSNRGVSGIDGSTSTAAGFSVANTNSLNVMISGDISFFYDSNAFWSEDLGGNLKVIVVNNGGGGIFQIIPGPAESHLSKKFFAPHKANVEGVCQTYNLNYYKAGSLDDLAKSVENFFSVEKNGRPSVLEINTQNAGNAEVLRSYFAALSGIQV